MGAEDFFYEGLKKELDQNTQKNLNEY